MILLGAGASGATLRTALLGLLAALTWGAGDFSGGLGSRAVRGSFSGTLRLVLAAHSLSLAVLVVLSRLVGDPLPRSPLAWHAAGWGLGAGVVAGAGLSIFYLALAGGEMGIAAAISSLITAAIPALVGWSTQGLPGWLGGGGCLAAAASLWFIAAPAPGAPTPNRRTQLLAILSGLSFGLYFVFLRYANPLGALEPLAIARLGAIAVEAALLLAFRISGRSAPAPLPRAAWLGAFGVAVFDSLGNLFYLAATRTGRLDFAAILASLYSVSTIVLAAFWLHERLTRRQWIGIACALAGTALLSAG